jgi:hypothetical protein
VFGLIFRFGDASRPFVDRLNMLVLGPLVILALGIMSLALLRFRNACREFAHPCQDPDRA